MRESPSPTQQDKPLQEINQYHDAAFPVGMYIVTKEQIVPQGRGYMDLHWHEDLQLTLVTNGRLELQVNGTGYALKTGEAIFINRNFVHITTALTDGGRYVSFNFPDKMLGFFAGSRMEQEDVLPYTSQYAFPAMVLKRSVAWQKEILEALETMQKLFTHEIWGEDAKKNEGDGSEAAGLAEPGQCTRWGKYRIAMILTDIWYQLITHIEDKLQTPSKGSIRKQERIQAMLSFIHGNYMNPIRLKEIAAAASVSVGECCRCFQEMIRKSPNQYLVAYRISRAMELLCSKEQSITEVAVETGFNDTSHFIQYFKKQTGMTPGEYRNRLLKPRRQNGKGSKDKK